MDETTKLKPHQWAEILCAPCWSSMKRSAETLEEWAPCDVCRPKVEAIVRSTEPKYEWLQRLPFPVAAKGDDELALQAMGVKTDSFAGMDGFIVERIADVHLESGEVLRCGPAVTNPWTAQAPNLSCMRHAALTAIPHERTARRGLPQQRRRNNTPGYERRS